MARRTVNTDEARQVVDDTSGANAAGDVDCQTLTGELVDDGQTLKLLTVRTRVDTKSYAHT